MKLDSKVLRESDLKTLQTTSRTQNQGMSILIFLVLFFLNDFCVFARQQERYSMFSLLPSAADRSVFACPEKFGYYADKLDCTKYFVCVFGEPLHESCTGGLYFSGELQTCDWPRNVMCPTEKKVFEKSVFSTVDIGDDDDNYEHDYDANSYKTSEPANRTSSESRSENRNIFHSYLDHLNSTISDENSLQRYGHSPLSRAADDVDHYFTQSNAEVRTESPKPSVFYTANPYDRVEERFVQASTEHPDSSKFSNQNDSKHPNLIELPHGNKINLEYDPQAPNYAEAIPSIYDSKGGIHFSDGVGGTYGIVGQVPGIFSPTTSDHNINVFIKSISQPEEKEMTGRRPRRLQDNQIGGIQDTLTEKPTSAASAYDSGFEYIPVITPEKLQRTAKNPFDYEHHLHRHEVAGFHGASTSGFSSTENSKPSSEEVSKKLESEKNRDFGHQMENNLNVTLYASSNNPNDDGQDREARVASPANRYSDEPTDKESSSKAASDEIILIPFTFNEGRRRNRVRVVPKLVAKYALKEGERSSSTNGAVHIFPGNRPDMNMAEYLGRDERVASDVRRFHGQLNKDQVNGEVGIVYQVPPANPENRDFNNQWNNKRTINNQPQLIHRNGHASGFSTTNVINIGDDSSFNGQQGPPKIERHNHLYHDVLVHNKLGVEKAKKMESSEAKHGAAEKSLDDRERNDRSRLRESDVTTTSAVKNHENSQNAPHVGQIIRTLKPQTLYSDSIRIFNGQVLRSLSLSSNPTDSNSLSKSEERDHKQPDNGSWPPLNILRGDIEDESGDDYGYEGGFIGSNNDLEKKPSPNRTIDDYFITTETTPSPFTTILTTQTTPFKPSSTTPTPKLSPPVLENNRKSRPTNKRLVVKHRTTLAPNPPSRPFTIYPTPSPLSQAAKCDPRKCLLPDCNCGGSTIPGNLPRDQVPQIVLLTFDDAVNDLNWEIYEEIFNSGRSNPNGCPLLGTFYVSHEWTDYGQVQTLYSRGHEMASHGVTHSFGEKFSKNQWHKEINGQREILHLYGGVKLEDVRGMRAPFLQIGGNKMFEMLLEDNFTYDSSMPVFDNKPPFWPYTLDYAINHECMISPCPSKSFPGVWEVGMVMWEDLKGGRCSMGDACSNPQDEDGVFEMLMKNFNRHYQTNRAPFGLFYHSAWFNTIHHRRGFMRFLDEILRNKNVYLTTKWQMIQWIRQPTPLSEIESFEPWKCDYAKNERPSPCHHPNVCNVRHQSGSRFMKTCQPCPTSYPWVGNNGFSKTRS